MFNRINRFSCLLMLILVTLAMGGCPIERLFPGKVADGIGRLTVANIGVLILALQQQKPIDVQCDFSVLKATPNAQVSGAQGQIGQVTWTYKDCIFDFGDNLPIQSNEKTFGTVSGRVKINATRVISGYLTGNPDFAVIPEGGDSVEFHFSRVEFDNFTGKLEGLQQNMTILHGDISFDAQVHLGRSSTYGLCTIPLPNLTVSNIVYNPLASPSAVGVRLPGLFGTFEAPVDRSNFQAQQGIFGGKTNVFRGLLTVWNNDITLPTDNLGLDPDFDPNNFDLQLTTINNLELPLSYDCPVDLFLATQAARLLIRNTGAIAQQFGFDNNCGLSAILNSNIIALKKYLSGDITVKSNKLIVATRNCRLSQPSPLFGVDCNNLRTYIEGTANATADAIVTGEITYSIFGYPLTPIARNPERLSLELKAVELKDYASYNVENGETTPLAKLTIKRGTLSGTVKPLFASPAGDKCKFTETTPNAIFQNIQLKDAQTTLEINFKKALELPDDLIMSFNLAINDSNLQAQNGIYRGERNWISGPITVDQKKHSMSEPDAQFLPRPFDLDPSFDPVIFKESYSCRVNCDPRTDVRCQTVCETFDACTTLCSSAATQEDCQKCIDTIASCYTPIYEIVPENAKWKPDAECQTLAS